MSLPGGCAIGNRPIDLHLKALEALGAEIEMAAGYVKATAPGGRLPGGTYTFPIVSVGATENARDGGGHSPRAAAIIENAAREPEIVDLCNLLVAMGATIDGHRHRDAGDRGRATGSTARPIAVMPDRIEAGSYACAAAITGGDARTGRRRARRHARDARGAASRPA